MYAHKTYNYSILLLCVYIILYTYMCKRVFSFLIPPLTPFIPPPPPVHPPIVYVFGVIGAPTRNTEIHLFLFRHYVRLNMFGKVVE